MKVHLHRTRSENNQPKRDVIDNLRKLPLTILWANSTYKGVRRGGGGLGV